MPGFVQGEPDEFKALNEKGPMLFVVDVVPGLGEKEGNDGIVLLPVDFKVLLRLAFVPHFRSQLQKDCLELLQSLIASTLRQTVLRDDAVVELRRSAHSALLLLLCIVL